MLVVLRLLLFLTLIICISAQSEFRCDYTKVNEANGWFKFHDIPSNWNEARLRCEMEGAMLASPSNLELKEAMKKLMDTKNITCAVYTGIHAIFSRGDFASIDGVRLSRIPYTWAKDEPDNYKDQESCIVMLRDGTIGDALCTDTFPYFCYKKGTGDKVLNQCGTTDDEYKYDFRTGHCYKYHPVKRTWPRAYMACMAEGGHLAVINSDTEAQVIIDLLNTYHVNNWVNFNFIGIHDWNEHGDWRTIHGTSLKAAGYDKWAKGEPNNSTTGEFCAAIYGGAQLIDLWCEVPYTFVCEMVPNEMCNEDDEILKQILETH